MLAGIAAARASGECQDKNIRSMNCWIDQDPVLSIKGKAISIVPEYEDLKKIAKAQEMPLKELRRKVLEKMSDKDYE